MSTDQTAPLRTVKYGSMLFVKLKQMSEADETGAILSFWLFVIICHFFICENVDLTALGNL